MSASATVLVVEDEQSLLRGITDLLELADTGYKITVMQAANGLQGLERMRSVTPDLIISDITMPGMNGLEFLENARRNSQWVHIPFIFVTARAKPEEVKSGRLTGAELYITKPWNNSELIELVKTQLDRTFALQALHASGLEKLKRDVMQLLNHEFRTPLTYVTAYYEMLADSLLIDSDADLQDYLRGIQVGCVRLTQLVENLIRLVDLRGGEAQTQYEREARPLLHIGEMFRDAALSRESEAAASQIAFKMEIEPNLPTVYGHAVFLLEIFDRLIDNAIKFTHARKRPDGQIALRAWASNGEIFLSVVDNGVGFPPHVRQQIFELFSQYNREQMEQQGSGSGLAIAQGLVELHHGRIQVRSRERMGSEFTVVLPVYDAAQRPLDAPPRLATVLLVEDDPFLLKGLYDLLEISEDRYKFRIITAIDGQDALNKLTEHQPDLIISDIMMPVVDGYELLARVRGNPAWTHIPFIFLSAKGQREEIHYGRRQGAEQYIVKPYDSEEMIDLVVSQLDRHFQVQSVRRQSFEELKRDILALLQPDFKMPLDSVTDYSQQLAVNLQTARTDADLRNSLQGLQEASARLTRLVEDFITLAEIKTGETEVSYQMRAAPFAADALLYSVGYQDWPLWPEIPISIDLNGESAMIAGDEKAITQALDRLLATAAFLHERAGQGRVSLGLSVHPSEAALSVKLDDAAFTPDEAAEIAALFGGNDQTALHKVGYGPGLTIVKGIVDLHGGRVQLDNQPDCYARFTLILPKPAD
jgi:two-component system, sensor histidine kinase and response regulator